MTDEQVWSAFSRDPRDPAQAALRASDSDRDVVHRMLAEAYADGRIDRGELDARTSQTEAARTLGDLLEPMQGLVSPTPDAVTRRGDGEVERRAVDAWRKERRDALWGLISVSAIVWTIWLVTSGPGSFPWPVFVSLAAALNLGKVQLNRSTGIDRHRRRLQEKQHKLDQPPPDSDEDQ